MRKDPVSRFFSYVNKTGSCWLWTGCRRAYRYGSFHLADKLISAHRYSWLIHRGEIPHKLHVLHTCDNPICVNPEHLWVGTHQDNMKDKSNKGRTWRRPRFYCRFDKKVHSV